MDGLYPQFKKGILILLFLLMIITTGFVGYILGKGSRFGDDMTGKAIDTVHVAQPEAKIHLGGKILYNDGTPYANGTVRLHSEIRETASDETGAFVFDNAEVGSHTISIVDSGGNELAKREITISRKDIEEGAKVKLINNKSYLMEVSVDIKYLEVQVVIDKEDGSLYIDPDKITYLTNGGLVESPTGKADIRNGIVVTPVGNIITTDGTIICGSGENENKKIIIPSGRLTKKADGTIETMDGTQVRPDGTVVNGNIVIDTYGISVTVDGKKQEPGEGGYQIVAGESTIEQIPLGKETEAMINGDEGSKEYAAQAGDQASGENNSGGDTPKVSTPSTQTPGSDNSEADTPLDTPSTDTPGVPDDSGPDNGVSFAGGKDKDQLKSWVQETVIDLFYNRTAGSGDDTLLAPGAEGYYLFRIINDNHFTISLDLSVSENDLHLPLEFAIADERGNLLTSWMAADGQTEVVTDKIIIEGRGKMLYQIRWRWPYHTSDAQDARDTQIGELKERSYTVNLSIRAEER